MLEYLLRGKTQRELFRLLWGRRVVAGVSTLSRLAGVSFSAAHRELETMRAAGLAVSERVGSELKYRAAAEHPHALLLGQLASVEEGEGTSARDQRDAELRGWLAEVGAPLAAPLPRTPRPPLEELLAQGLALSHRDATVARVFPVVLWQRRHDMDLDRPELSAESGSWLASAEGEPSPGLRRRRLSWARLIKRVSEVDPLLCPYCQPR